MILVRGKKCKVVEDLGYNHNRGVYAKVVIYKGQERVVIKRGGVWDFAIPIWRIVSSATGQEVRDEKI